MPEGEPSPDDILTILVATDTHLGYMEKDPIRGLDSFAAFEEVLLLAKQHKVDFVLLGGDLFHENKPSRRTLYRAVDILRRHCMGPDAVRFQVVSDQKANFKGPFGGVNYEDPFFSVGLPVFSIHGNHDDPTRDSGMESLAAVDILQAMNLINYFGKSEQVDNVEVNPVLLEKGASKVALYGLGSMRDERLNRMWNSKKVKFLRPEEDAGQAQFFNIFVLHQNRDTGRGKKNCVHESMIPEWMDLIIWGHEHECRIHNGPEESMVGTFRVVQPGSSVATSLVEGEAVQKAVALLRVSGSNFLLEPLPLTQVRSFKVEEVCLGDMEELDPDSPSVEADVAAMLRAKVEAVVAELRQESPPPPPLPKQLYKLEHCEKVLVRVRVEHTGFPTINMQRFGGGFVEEVANPSDLLLFHKKRASAADSSAAAKGTAGGAVGTAGRLGAAFGEGLRGETGLEEVSVEDLVENNLQTANGALMLLPREPMSLALEDYVKKGEAGAISDVVGKVVRDELKRLMKTNADTDGAIKEEISKAGVERQAAMQPKGRRAKHKAPDADAPKEAAAGDGAMGGGRGVPSGQGGSSDLDDDLEDDDDRHRGGSANAAAAAPRQRAPAVGRGAKAATVAADADDSDERIAPLKPRGRAAKCRATAAVRSRKKPVEDDVVSLDDSESDSAGRGGKRGAKTKDKAPAPARRSTRPAAWECKRYAGGSDSEELDEAESGGGDDDDHGFIPSDNGGRGGRSKDMSVDDECEAAESASRSRLKKGSATASAVAASASKKRKVRAWTEAQSKSAAAPAKRANANASTAAATDRDGGGNGGGGAKSSRPDGTQSEIGDMLASWGGTT